MRCRPPTPRALVLGLLAGGLLGGGLGACGGGGAEVEAASAPAPGAAPRVAFPKATATTRLADLRAGLPAGPILEPAVSVLEPGRNRFGFALFDAARKQIGGTEVAVYTARPDGTGVKGPYAARSESLAVQKGFEAQGTTQDPDSAKSVYVAQLPFKRTGKVVVTALVRLNGRLMATETLPMEVGSRGALPPRVGEPAIPIDTETVASVGGDLGSIDTRMPPAPELHEVNARDVLGKRPTVLLFATPSLCQSRVCGPVVDVALQVRSEVGGDVAWVHQEVFKENDVRKGVRAQLGRWRLVTEPWIFVIDRQGTIRARFEGALSVAELKRAVEAVA